VPGAHPEAAQRLALGVEVLAVGAAGIADPQGAHGQKCPRCHPVTGRVTGRPVRDTEAGVARWWASAMKVAPVEDRSAVHVASVIDVNDVDASSLVVEAVEDAIATPSC